MNISKKSIFLLTLVLLISFVSFFSFFVIMEGTQAIVTLFGKPTRTITSSGLHWKIPFLEEVRVIDARILNWDGYPNEIPTKDKKYIKVDTTARWQIVDPLKFIQKVQSERIVKTRLDAILDAATRDVISRHNLVETVRNTNDIFEVIKRRKEQLKEDQNEMNPEEKLSMEEEIIGEIDSIDIGREKLSQLIIERGMVGLAPLGIKLIDVQLKRISLKKEVEEKVFDRMISERQRIAEKIRSIGKGEKAKIQGKIEKDLKQIQSTAYREVQKIKGEGEAKAIAIYANAFNQDSTFYKFLRTLEVYEKGINEKTKFILSTDSELWSLLKKGKP